MRSLLFEADLPTRSSVPPEDVRRELLVASERRTTCPYAGRAGDRSIKRGDRVAEDAVWAYHAPVPDGPQIKGYSCSYREELDRLEVEGEYL